MIFKNRLFPVVYRYYEAIVHVVLSDHFPVVEVSK